KRGPDFVRKQVQVQIPFGQIRYAGVAKEGSTLGVAEKYGDQAFALSFARPPGTNGGWDLAHFLRVHAQQGSEEFESRQRHLLEDVYLLENEARTVLQFIWPLDEQGKARLLVTTVQYPSHEEWIFLRVQIEGGEDVDVTRVDLSCFPGNTAGPPERQRWIASP